MWFWQHPWPLQARGKSLPNFRMDARAIVFKDYHLLSVFGPYEIPSPVRLDGFALSDQPNLNQI
jgi:hypothetical protein